MILQGDARKIMTTLPANEFQACITSPPYWALRDYDIDGQIGLEENVDDFIESLVQVFREVRRCLKRNGVLWVVIGDTYFGGRHNRGNTKPLSNKQMENRGAQGQTKRHRSLKMRAEGLRDKDLVGIPWRLAFALQADDWFLRSDVIWSKPNPMPESVKDRCTKSHEHIFMLTKSEKYFFNNDAILEPAFYGGDAKWAGSGSIESGESYAGSGKTTRRFRAPGNDENFQVSRQKRDVWVVPTQAFPGAHFATFPEKLIEPCVLATTKAGDKILDPFMGSGTTAVVAERFNRDWLGIELNPNYLKLAERRLIGVQKTLDVW